MSERRVVITGLGTINPLGCGVPAFWDGLTYGRSGVSNVCGAFPELKDYEVQVGGYVPIPEDIEKYFGNMTKWIKRLDKYILYLQVAATEALRDSGIDAETEDPYRVGCLLSSGGAGIETHEKNQKILQSKGLEDVSPLYVLNAMPNVASGFFSVVTGFKGPNFCISSACSSSNYTIGVASMLIENDLADVIFAGASEGCLTLSALSAFGNLGALSVSSADPARASCPFSRHRNGFIISDGAGVLCLEELEHAKRRGAKIYAEVTGYGFSGDAHDMIAPDPRGRGAEYSMRQCLRKAGVGTEQISLINAHGTSTPLGDLSESLAVESVFGAGGNQIPVHSTKSMLGHTISAAGSIEAVAIMLAFERGIVHPSINCEEQDEQIRINVVKEARDDIPIRHVLSNSFAFGGHNATVLYSAFE